jgi:hypothetical protein
VCRQDSQKSALVARHNELVDILWEWKQPTTRCPDLAYYFPIEIVERIFSFVVYHVGDLGSETQYWWKWRECMPSNEIIAGFQYAPLILASVSKTWCRIATNYSPLWSTIFIDQSEGDYPERIQLFLDRSGKEPLEIILLDHTTPTPHLNDFLVEYADRFKTLVGLADEVRFYDYSFRMETPQTSTGFVNWSVYASKSRRISTVPIPKCLRRLQLHQSRFDSTSLIHFTYFHNLESLSILVALDPMHMKWDTTLRFELLRHLRLEISKEAWSNQSNSESVWIERLECPALVDLDLVYRPRNCRSNAAHIRLEACLLRFRTLQNLRVHTGCTTGGAVRDVHEYPIIFSPYDGKLELVQLTVDISPTVNRACMGPFAERLFSTFVPNTHLAWPYGQIPSPFIFTNIKTMHIQYLMEGDEIAHVLVAPQTSQLEFPLLEELYLQYKAPRLLDLLRAPRLISLRIDGFTPSDLRHISNTTLLSIRLKIIDYHPDSQGIYLPSAEKLQLDLEVLNLFHLNVHPSLIQSITINTDWQEETLLPPNWAEGYVSDMLGTVTDLKVTPLQQTGFGPQLMHPSQTIPSFLKPFVYLQRLKLSWEIIGQCPCIDQLAQHLTDPDFLPELEALSISEYPSWPEFFQCIQERQIGHLTGQFRTGLKQITIKGPIHGVLLEHLRESLAGKYIGLSSISPCRGGARKWAVLPYEDRGSGTNRTMCCYVCHKAGLELGCMILPSQRMLEMVICSRHPQLFKDWESNTVFAP